MPAVFVHGNPETSAIWGPLVTALSRTDVVLLSPPGFGAPTPAGWGATREEYAAWLVGELEAIGEPVDLVGHDWGGGHVLAVAIERPDLLRSWASDVLGIVEADYVWHDMAQAWQTPEVGEQVVEAFVGMPAADRAAAFSGMGMGDEVGAAVAEGLDAEMGRCILALYRSAAQPRMAEVGARLAAAAARPGLAIVPTGDEFTGGPAMAARAAERAGATVAELEELGHWWMLQDPGRGARILESFWSAAAAH